MYEKQAARFQPLGMQLTEAMAQATSRQPVQQTYTVPVAKTLLGS